MPATALKFQGNQWIPEICPKELSRRMTQIRPVIRDKGIPYFVEPVDPVNQSYLWNPTTTGRAVQLKEVAVITTYHEFTSYGKFEPTVAEVLAAIPDQWLHGLVAFEIIEQPESVDDLRRAPAALADDHHMARTRLYRDA